MSGHQSLKDRWLCTQCDIPGILPFWCQATDSVANISSEEN